MASAWRVIIDESLPGIENMARDDTLLEKTRTGDTPMTTLRFYRWIIPTLSLGNKQEVEKAANLDFCRDNGIDIVRRPTGGGSVLHHMELTYSVVSNDRDFFPEASILGSYKLIAQALCRGMEILGVPVEAVSKKVPDGQKDSNYVKSPVPCFTSPSEFEICAKGKKIIGSAQKRIKKTFLQHGSIPYQLDWELQAGSMRSTKVGLQESMTCISEHISTLPGIRDMFEALLQGFTETFRFKFIIQSFSDEEIQVANSLLNNYKVDY